MTAGSGILHDELPTERAYNEGGPFHGIQLWVNLPSALKMTPPRYQAITRDDLVLLTSDDGGALVRLIAGDVAGFTGPGVTHTPITDAHVTLAPGAQLSVPWNPAFSAMAYVLTGRGTAGPEGRPVQDGQLVALGPGDHAVVAAADRVPYVAGWPAGAWLAVAAVSIAAGIWADLGALMIAAFLIPTSGFLHPFWKVEDSAQRQTQQQGFLRNVSFLGAALALFAVFASIDDGLRFAVTGSLIHLS